MFKVGLGQDSHKFEEKGNIKPLILGGVLILDEPGLKANSDGDVVMHALFNALSSAVGGHSLGVYADPLCLEQGVSDSKEYIKIALKMISKANYQVNNIALSIEAKKPRISLELVNKMKKQLAILLKVKPNSVGITFTSGEGLTPFGRGEAIQVFALVSVIKK